jgi:hypothetical protein
MLCAPGETSPIAERRRSLRFVFAVNCGLGFNKILRKLLNYDHIQALPLHGMQGCIETIV